MKCVECGTSIPELPEDTSYSEMLCNRCYEIYEFGLLKPAYRGDGYVDISFATDEGGVIAYVVDTSKENLFNWLESCGYSMLYKILKKTFKRVAILRSMMVEEEQRGLGIGNRFVEKVLSLALENDANAVLLVADLGESNKFDLVDWYKRWGFEIISKENQNPLMQYRIEN